MSVRASHAISAVSSIPPLRQRLASVLSLLAPRCQGSNRDRPGAIFVAPKHQIGRRERAEATIYEAWNKKAPAVRPGPLTSCRSSHLVTLVAAPLLLHFLLPTVIIDLTLYLVHLPLDSLLVVLVLQIATRLLRVTIHSNAPPGLRTGGRYRRD
jgi:hypothetical protein